MSEARQRLSRLQGSRATLQEQLAAKRAQQAALDTEIEVLAEALRVVEELAQGTRSLIGSSVSDLGSSAMRDIFGADAGCLLQWVAVGERGDHRPQFLSWDREGVAQDPMDGNGASAADVLATALRIWFLVKLGGPRILWLDEPLTGVSVKNKPRALGWLRNLAHELDIQIVAILHADPEVIDDAADHILGVRRQGPVSEAQVVR